MPVDIEIHKYDSYPSLRSFMLHGMPPIPQEAGNLRFDVVSSADRAKAVKDSQEARFPIGTELLRMPYFKRLVVRNIKGAVPCIDLTVNDNFDWNAQSNGESNRPSGNNLMNQSLQTASIETIIKHKITAMLSDALKLVGEKGLTSSYNLASMQIEAGDFVRNLKVQETVKSHGGKLYLHSIDPSSGIATIVMEGNCGSGGTCQGSQVITRANVSQSLRARFPDIITTSRFLEAAP